MERYPVNPLEDLNEEQFDMLLGGDWAFTQETQDRIVSRVAEGTKEPKPRRRRRRIMIAAVAAAMGLMLMGFANFDRIQQLVTDFFGGDGLGEYAAVIDETATDQGFTLMGIAAVKDGEATYLFMDLKDEEGGRLADDLYFSQYDARGIARESNEELSMYGIGCKLLSYDPGAEMATLVIELQGDFQQDTAEVMLYAFGTGLVEVEKAAVPGLYEAALQSQAVLIPLDWDDDLVNGYGWGSLFEDRHMSEEEIVHLEVGSQRYAAEGYGLHTVTNVAYADGLLHVQVQRSENRIDEGMSVQLWDKDGEPVECLYYVTIGEQAGYGGVVLGEYIEYVYDIGDLENLKDMTFGFTGWYYENAFGGEWSIELEVPEEIDALEIPGQQISVDGQAVSVEGITVTPVSVTVVYGTYVEALQDAGVTAILKDGSRVAFPETGSIFDIGDGHECRYIDGVVSLDEVSEIEIFGHVFSAE